MSSKDNNSWQHLREQAGEVAASDPYAARTLMYEALLGAIDHKAFAAIEEIWLEMIEAGPQPITPLLDAAQRLLAKHQKERTTDLLGVLLDSMSGADTARDRIDLLKLLNTCTPDSRDVRDGLEQAYSQLHPDIEKFDMLVRRSGLRSKSPVVEACIRLERYVRYGVGRCVLHQGWGVGIVTRLDTLMGKVHIDFPSKLGHEIEIDKIDEQVFVSLLPEDFRAVWVVAREQAKEWGKTDPVRLVKSVLISCDGEAKNPAIKRILTGTVLTEQNWSSWWSAVQEQLKSDPFIEIQGKVQKTYILRETEVDPSQLVRARIDGAALLPEKLGVWCDWLRERDCDHEVARELAQSLISFGTNRRHPEWQVLLSYTFSDVQKSGLISDLPEVPVGQDLAADPDQAVQILCSLRDPRHRVQWLAVMQETLGAAMGPLCERMLLEQADEIREAIDVFLQDPDDRQLIAEVWWRDLARFQRQHPVAYAWFATRAVCDAGFTDLLGADRGNLLESCLRLLEFVNYRNSVETDRQEAAVLRSAGALVRDLFRVDRAEMLGEVVGGMSSTLALRVATRVFHESAIDDPSRKRLLQTIFLRFPEVEVHLHSTGRDTERDRLEQEKNEYIECLLDSLDTQREVLRRIVEEDIPANIHDIATARAHGDLRENAEYKAAKDRQRLLYARAGSLEADIERARVHGLEDVQGSEVEFGVRVVMSDNETSQREEFVVLGPWESQPEAGVLSCKAPLAQALMGHVVGDQVQLVQSGKERMVTIRAIEPLRQWPLEAQQTQE